MTVTTRLNTSSRKSQGQPLMVILYPYSGCFTGFASRFNRVLEKILPAFEQNIQKSFTIGVLAILNYPPGLASFMYLKYQSVINTNFLPYAERAEVMTC